jgi:hypothetical protein
MTTERYAFESWSVRLVCLSQHRPDTNRLVVQGSACCQAVNEYRERNGIDEPITEIDWLERSGDASTDDADVTRNARTRAAFPPVKKVTALSRIA